jgi:hypothetical protein
MSGRKLLGWGAFILFVVAASTSAFSDEQQATALPGGDLTRDLKDKIVLLEVNRSSAVESDSDTVLLKDVRLTELGNRHFILGIGYSAPDDINYWYEDMLIGVPCDSILRFSAMTPEQCAKFMKKWKDQVQE